jgi:hypothetical protein
MQAKHPYTGRCRLLLWAFDNSIVKGEKNAANTAAAAAYQLPPSGRLFGRVTAVLAIVANE